MGEQPKGTEEHPRPRRPAGMLYTPPWLPVVATAEIVGAFRAIARGEAMPHQQVMALKFIREVICEADDMSYRPGEEGRRDSDFAEGKRYVGNQVAKLTNLDPRMFDQQPRGE